MSDLPTTSVIGAGAWGTALAINACTAGHQTTIWTRAATTADEINIAHRNTGALGQQQLPTQLSATTVLSDAVANADLIFLVVPAQTMATTLIAIRPHIGAETPIVICAKGIDQKSGKLMSEIVSDHLPTNLQAALSGPSFARDVAAGLPTAVTLAAENIGDAEKLASLVSTPVFRCYASDDLRGVELGGALKNVLALAVGMADGLGLGASAKAALTTRGFAELHRLSTALGARAETLYGLSGLGDLILTCSSDQSRNFAYGRALARQQSVQDLPLAEGASTAHVAAKIAAEHHLDTPIIAAVATILTGQSTVEETVQALLSRPLRRE
jgi:glycerol-3-phosphate dehydrogenase (NAD(P)+)